MQGGPRCHPPFCRAAFFLHSGRFLIQRRQGRGWYAMDGVNERKRDALLGVTNHSGPDGRSCGDWRRRGDTPQVDTCGSYRRTPPPALRRVGFNVGAPVGAWNHVSSGGTPDEPHPQPHRKVRQDTGAPPEGGGAILYVATRCQPVGCPRMPTNPHNPACRGGS